MITICTILLSLTMAGAFALNVPEDLPAPDPFWPSLNEGWRVLRSNQELVIMTVVIVLTNAAEGLLRQR